jgi:hypothetical protein
MDRTKTFLLVLVATFYSTTANADLIQFTQVRHRLPNPAEISGGVPAGSHILGFLVTTDGDILSVNNIKITLSNASLYNHQLGDPASANSPDPQLIGFFPAVAADTFIDTPGIGVRLGPDLPGDGTTTFGDLTNDGPQTNFKFAQLTFIPTTSPEDISFTFEGRVSIAGGGGTAVYSQPFNFITTLEGLTATYPFTSPEPTTAALGAASLLSVVVARRRART